PIRKRIVKQKNNQISPGFQPGVKGSATNPAASTAGHSLQITNMPRNIETIIHPGSEALILFIFLSDNNEKE
ncbi:MAG: hypothetical protein ACQERU_10360, partial [Bacteroidota bacterium]